MSLQRSHIEPKIQPIRCLRPIVLGLRQGQVRQSLGRLRRNSRWELYELPKELPPKLFALIGKLEGEGSSPRSLTLISKLDLIEGKWTRGERREDHCLCPSFAQSANPQRKNLLVPRTQGASIAKSTATLRLPTPSVLTTTTPAPKWETALRAAKHMAMEGEWPVIRPGDFFR